MDDEPLGYKHFLYNVNIEWTSNRGTEGPYLTGNKHCFKMKYLPYMVRRSSIEQDFRKNSATSSDSSICDNQTIQDDDSIISLDPRYIDVTKATCAFLGNSDYVPNDKLGCRRVVLEIISAKLSQPTTFNVPPNTNSFGLITLPEQPSLRLNQGVTSPIHQSDTLTTNGSNQSPSAPSISSKRYVNYTILIKITPGLDNHPAVIERRFSDFLQLYQGLKSQDSYAKIVDKYITFPKKVYMGNFSLTNIAERSIEFSRLLSLCISNINLLWSNPFISFLLDKELKEAHKLSLCGDPDNVQALIETAYFIERKLFLNRGKSSPVNRASSTSLDVAKEVTRSPSPTSKPLSYGMSSINETISIEGASFSEPNGTTNNLGSSLNSSPSQSIWDTSEDLERFPHAKATNLVPLDQRILVTFCMLFLTYYRGENYQELRVAVQEFNQLISGQDFVDSLVNSRHYITLRACLLFLMNMNRGDVIEEDQRLWLKQKLEDIDGVQADLEVSKSLPTIHTSADNNMSSNSSLRSANKKRGSNSEISNGTTNVTRISGGDLTSLLRDRSFCSF